MHISKNKRCFNVKYSTYYFHMKTKILADFQICISLPLRIISFIPQRQRMQANFMNHTYQTTNQTNNPNNQNNDISVGFTTNTKFALTTETTQIQEFSYSNFNQFQKIHIQPISYISCITNLCISSIPKNLYLA